MAFARGISARRIDRFACDLGDVGDLVPLLCASSMVGSEACVYPAGLDEATIADYLSSFDQRVFVTDREVGRGAEVIPPSALASAGDGAVSRFGDGAPAMILTTGTTGKPKGVRYDWSNLIAAIRHPDDTPGARWLLAYNLNQFAGIQVLLHVLASAATLVVPVSNQPRDAVVAMRDLGVTHVSATPTFWRFVISLLDEQVARQMPLKQITLGGEPSPGPLLEALRGFFPNAKISHVYAGTEFGPVVSVRDGRPGLPLTVLERGDDAAIQLKVIDGELMVRSRVGMRGYFGGDDVDEGWRPTGDLVEVTEDRILFVGRTSDVINVGGVKVHPLPVEEVAASVEGVELARAYGRPSPVTGEIVALDVVAKPGADKDAVERALRVAAESLAPAARPRRIRFVDQIDVRGHKILRGPRS
jgi:acyl-CoA synthetase (AMP-forming)/AMP-acid ligase II